MADTLVKLRPDRDLQCFYFQPSAIAALSRASAEGFTLSGAWRQQFDWAVVEWNRDNIYEHPAFRNLPDGDLSGLTLTYQEARANCIPLDSQLYATVDWPSVRIWATSAGGTETIYWVPLASHAQPVTGSYQCAYADFTLSGTIVAGDYIGLAVLTEHYTYQLLGTDTLMTAAQAVANIIDTFSSSLKATASGVTVRVFHTGGTTIAASTSGSNGNRFGVYSYSTGSATWDSVEKTLANGTSPTHWQISLNFGSLQGTITPDLSGLLYSIPTSQIRKIRWTYAADLQSGAYQRSEFQVVVSNWAVTGTNRPYFVAGQGSVRIEDTDPAVIYTGTWAETRGNYSGGTIHQTSTNGDALGCSYHAPFTHTLYAGLRYTANGGTASIAIDAQPAVTINLDLSGEDVLFRHPVGTFTDGPHVVSIKHTGTTGTDVYFDFLELAIPTQTLPVFPAETSLTLATDWDTLHSLSIPPERTAWFLDSLGFAGRANHYVGALWFYELVRTGQQYASATVTFAGTPQPNFSVSVTVDSSTTPQQKLIHVGDTAATIATAFAQEYNSGYTGVWASASGGVLTLYSRAMGLAGDAITITASTTSSGFTATASGTNFSGGADGDWRTDLTALPRLNRAVRDWSSAYFTALKSFGFDVAAAFSMEIQHGDPSTAVGIAQVGPLGDPVVLPTPSLQTNFSPTSIAFWKEVYLEMAGLQASAGLTPFVQFGEVQWWYFPNDGVPGGRDYRGMPFYDAWNLSNFQAIYGHALGVITTNTVSPTSYPDEVAYLPTVIGNFTSSIMTYVRATYSSCRFEVLYPTDVNQTAFNQAINYPIASWTPANITNLKTEAFGFTLQRDLDQSIATIHFGSSLGFTASQRSHLIGISDAPTAWLKEARFAAGSGFESVVLFALDQFCLIGYGLPLKSAARRVIRLK